VNPGAGRWGEWRAALSRTLGRPIAFALVTGSIAFVFAALALAALAAWRIAPFEAPAWTRAEALVLVAGAEGELDLAALRGALRGAVQPPDILATVDFVGRDAALRELAQRKNLAAIGLSELRPNPLPDAFRVRFVAGAAPDLVETAVGALRKVKGVDSIEFQPELGRRAAALAQLAGRLGAALAALLGASLLLAVLLAATFWSHADPQELRVLYLLGAEPAAVVRPAAYAAGISLGCAALLAWWFVADAGNWLEPGFAALARQYQMHWSEESVPPWVAPLACALAALFGALLAGGVLHFSVRRRLRSSG
jgi:cell division protein FtsX